MSNYTKSTNFATKDNLPTGDPLKIVKGTEIDTEFNNIATAISTKTDNASAAITGGSITGITDLAIADGGTGASTATAAINNLLPSQTSNANKYLQTDGTNVSWDAISINTGDITGTLPVANGGTGVTSSTGTGSVVLSNSPTLVTPSLGAATASTLDVSGNVTLSGGTANSIPYLNGSKVVTTGTELYFNGTNLGVGTSASYRVDLGSATSDDAAVGIRIGRGGSNTTWALIDNVGGSGNYRQYSSGTPTLRWLTSTNGTSWSEQMRLNATGLGVGNNNPTEKLDVTGSALVSGSVTATSFAGALNGTVGATTPTTGAFTTIAASSSVTLSGGTANGVTYLNGSKVLTSGSALTFDGTTFKVAKTGGVFGPTNLVYVDVTSSYGGVTLNSASGQNCFFELYQGGTTKVGEFGIDAANSLVNIGGFGSYNTRFYASGSEGMRLNGTGLGIGTSSVSTGLRLVKTPISSADYFNNTIASFETNTSDGLAIYRPAATTIGLKVNSSRDMVFGIGDQTPSEIMRMTTTGLGIGTSSPATKLEVAGDVRLTGANPSLQAIPTSSGFFIDNRGVGKPTIFRMSSASAIDTTAATIDSAGNLGLGVTPSTSNLPTIESQYGLFVGQGQTNIVANGYYSSGYLYKSTAAASRYQQISGSHVWYNAASGTAGNAISFTQALTLDASGFLFLGCTTTPSASVKGIRLTPDFTTNTPKFSTGSATGLVYMVEWINGNGIVGSISTNGSATAYNTSSDYRLKNITGPITNSGNYIDNLNPVEGTWKADGSTFVGLIAHEVQEASRTQVATGTKDGAEMQAMDYSSAELIANLIAEVKSLRQRVATLEAQ